MTISDLDAKRFWRKVDKDGPIQPHTVHLGQCWEWIGYTGRAGGYGDMKVGDRMERAHRISWVLHNGQIPFGKDVLHRCDWPRCVSPNHLFLGTDADNVRDRVKKGRSADQRGEKCPTAKLTNEQVLAIREAAKRGASATVLARRYQTTYRHIRRIITRTTWTHL